MANTKKTIFILDAYGLVYRSYFAFISRPLTNSRGENVSAVFGFFKSLHNIMREYNPKLFIVALDSKAATFRHKMYPEYKATRNKTPDDLYKQIDTIEEILLALKLPMIRQDGFEADDVIASVCKKAKDENRNAVIISGDKDLMQLVDETTEMLKPAKSSAWEKIDSSGVIEQWGVAPDRMLDFLSLIGDSADNIPGVKGIGPKTAVKLLDEYKSLDGIFKNIENLKGSTKTKLEAGRDSAYFSKKLIELNFSVEVNNSLDEYSSENLNLIEATKIFLREELPNIARLYSKDIDELNIGENKSDKAKTNQITSNKVNIEYNEQNLDPKKIKTVELLPKEILAKESIDLPQNRGNYKCVNTKEELFKIIDNVITAGSAAYDCETTSTNSLTTDLCGFSISLNAGEAYYFPLKAPMPELGEEPYKLLKLADVTKALNKLFGSKTELIMHNGKFDIQVAIQLGLCKEFNCTLFDTMIAAWLLDPNRSSYGMDKLAESIFKVKTIKYKDIVKQDQNFSTVPVDIATNYAAEDADITLKLYEKFKPLLKTNSLEKLFYELEMPITLLLTKMEIEGIYLKKNELTEYSKELGKQINELENNIYEIVGHSFNIASPKQLQQILFEERKLKPTKKTKTGYSTDTTVLENLASEDIVPAKILEYRAFAKLKSTYTDSLTKLTCDKSRVHTSFIQTGTATGRLSSREPNLQNIPIKGNEGRRIRKAFQAEEGCDLISADYSQIELVILAHLSGDKNLQEAFNTGLDVHSKTASLIFAVDLEQVDSDMRRIAKSINFGVMYGMSAFRLANELHIPRRRASDFINAYFSTYSGVSRFIAQVTEQAETDGFVETIMGRRRYIPTINSKNKIEKASAERMAVNTSIQGSAADIVKMAMLEVDAALKKEKLKTKMLLQVHDELILEAPKEETVIIKKLIKEKMEGVIKLSVPLRVSIESGKCWGDFH